MRGRQKLLSLCEKISNVIDLKDFKYGDTIVRGYADIGYEEFILLKDSKIISKISGEISDFPEEHRKFFFLLPSIDKVIQIFTAKGGNLKKIENLDNREWSAFFILNSEEEREIIAESLEELVVNLLAEACSIQLSSVAPRKLRVVSL